MRRELSVFIPTTESDVEVSLKGIDPKGETILFNLDGHRFAVTAKDLQDAMDEIKAFQIRNNPEGVSIPVSVGSALDFTFGDSN